MVRELYPKASAYRWSGVFSGPAGALSTGADLCGPTLDGAMMADATLSGAGILARLASGVALVLATYNPAKFSYLHWALSDLAAFSAPQAVVGVMLVGAWVFCVRAAITSLGQLGVTLLSLLIASLIWLLVELGVLGAPGPQALAWLSLVGIGLVLGVGLCWSLVRRQVTGQVVVDDVER